MHFFKKNRFFLFYAFLLFFSVIPVCAQAADPIGASLFNVQINQDADPGKLNVVLQIFLLMTVLSLAPSILVMVTCFTRIAVVLSLLRQAMGTQQLPANQIIIGLALFLTFYVMSPVWKTIHEEAIKPYLGKKLSAVEAFDKAVIPLRKFMIKHTREKDLGLMIEVSKLPRPKNIDQVPTHILVPAFIVSELKTSFQIGFMLYIPFLIIDMVVASVLLSMGMMMLPPVMVSLPFKLMIFVLTDGWYLIIGSLVKSFTV
ncbi:MAG: flagellar type III secretion system pore protein FliP [Desulfobacteraceae bacterium]|nr:flagellar type III secretion system pore protein FliP [Desulfobacteraceae bacterium]